MDDKGFSLLEVMVALAVMAIALAALIGLQSQAVGLASEARFYTTAALLAQGKASELEAIGVMTNQSGDFGEPFQGYRWSIAVEDASAGLPFEGNFHLKRATITVSWGEGEYSYRVSLYLFTPGG